MSEQSYTGAYVAAMEAATAQLEVLFEEAAQLRERLEKINSVIDALKPLFPEYEMDSELNSIRQSAELDLALV